METLKDLQLEHMMVPVVQVVSALVVPTMAAMTVDEPVAPGEHALTDQVLATTAPVPAPTAVAAASAGRKFLEQHV